MLGQMRNRVFPLTDVGIWTAQGFPAGGLEHLGDVKVREGLVHQLRAADLVHGVRHHLGRECALVAGGVVAADGGVGVVGQPRP
eukprot:1190100-Prorocentrum_minimum.AAC.1